MRTVPKIFLAVLLLTITCVSWGACPEGTRNNYKGECVAVGAEITTSPITKSVKLTIESNVQARVYINERYKGPTPRTLELPVGSYIVRVEKDGHKSREEPIALREDRTVWMSLDLLEGLQPGEVEPKSTETVPKSTPKKESLSLPLVGSVIGITFLFLVYFLFGRRHRKEEKKRAEEEAEQKRLEEEERTRAEADRQRKEEATRSKLAQATTVVSKAFEELRVDTYFSFEMMNQWLVEYDQLQFLGTLEDKDLEYSESPKMAHECKVVFKDSESYRSKFNQKFIEKELGRRKGLFDSLEKYPLTNRQREAILRNDNRVLTVAGAGTGKTSTVVGKVAYLLDSGWCKPQEILLLSYSRGAVAELKERIQNIGWVDVDIRTIHSLGLHVIEQATGKSLDVPQYVSRLKEKIWTYLRELLNNDEHCKELIEYLVFHFYPTKYDDDFASTKEFNHFATGHDLRALQKDLKTLKREQVRSFQEVQIANWLYTHGVKYEYEKQYEKIERRYRPDFYLTDHDIYIEHWGIDRKGFTRPDIDKDKYRKSMDWKIHLHEQKGTYLIETFSYEFKEGNVFEILETKLRERQVPITQMGNDELRKNASIKDDLKTLAKLTSTFLNLFKSSRITLSELINEYPEEEYYRESLFLKVFSNVLRLYEDDLKKTGAIDFGDMIIQATDRVDSGQFRSPYKAIIVDEFQDITRAQAELIYSFQEQNPDTRFLCVGDDWQSIYRFTGSDVSLMTNYENEWEGVVRIDLDRSFRFNDKILKLSSLFIQQNPLQLKKTIKTDTTMKGPAVHITGKKISDVLSHIHSKISQVNADPKVFVLGRYNHTDGVRESYPRQRVAGMTVHQSKGLEADYVIVSDVLAGKYGFPTQIDDDPILSMLLTKNEKFLNSEERRLFYVAITRARKEVWLLEPKEERDPPSEFLVELTKDKSYQDLVGRENLKLNIDFECPRCKSPMQRRINKKTDGVFLGCMHFPRCDGTVLGCPSCNKGFLRRVDDNGSCSNRDCDHVPDVCPTCKDGILVLRKGRSGSFIGCSAYPDCEHNQPVN